MSTFAQMLNGFAALATQLTGLQIVQAHMPVKATDPIKKGRLEYRVIACRPISKVTDEIRYAFDTGTNTLVMTSEGMREITIQTKFIGYDNRPTQDALFYLERLGDRLAWPSSVTALQALDMALVARESFIDLSRVISAEDRVGSIGVKDFRFNAVVTEAPDNPTDNPTNWIEVLEFYSAPLLDVDGNPSPHQIAGSVTRPP